MEELRLQAGTRNASGHPSQGARLVDRALVLLDQEPAKTQDWLHARARLLITRAFSEFEIHGWERGQHALDAATTAAEVCDSPDLDALIHELRGLIAFRSGRLDDSVLYLDASVRLLAHLDPEDRATILLNRGAVHLLRQDLRAARTDLSMCAQIGAEFGLVQLEFKARHNLGYAEFLAGDIPAALRAFDEADALDTDVSRSVWFLDRARVLMEAGLLEEADQALQSATDLLRRERASQDRAETELARAEVALIQGDWETAKKHSARARRDFRRRQSVGWQARADVTRWQAYLDSKGGPARVAREIRSALAEGEDGRIDRELAVIAAEAHLALGHVEEAAALLQGVQRRSNKDPLSSQMHHHLVRAGVARAAGDVQAARRELRTGLSALTRQQAQHHSMDLRTAMAIHGGRLAELDLRMALESGSARIVFDSVERWRAMSHRRKAVTPPRDPELADLLSRLRIVVEQIRNSAPGEPVDQMRRRQLLLERQVREREWRLESTGRAERSFTLAELRSELSVRQTDVALYFVLDRRLHTVIVRSGRATVFALAEWSDVAGLMSRIRADLDAVAGRLIPEPLRRAISSSLTHDLQRLDRLLLPDALGDSHNVLVVPSRTLATVPWTLLPRRRGRPTTVSLSATSWLRRLRTDPTANPRVAALAGPGLPLADAEVAAVALTWPGATSLASAAGSAAELAAALTSNDLVHIAAHGTHNHENPLFSSIRMADGPLFAYDIPPDESVAGHVVLSACDLGLATPRLGGEVLGLTAALLGIGARSVVSSVSRVDDATAYEVMQRYHALLAKGLDSATALAQSGSDDPALPAPFVCFGSPWSAAPVQE